MINPQYLGDAVYVHQDEDSLVLTTEHHDPAKAGNCIFLEPEVLAALMKYITRLQPEAKLTLPNKE